jgi:hypothetical protein
MRTVTKIVLFFTGIILTSFLSCQKFEEYPIEPQIQFQKFTLLVDSIITGDTFELRTERGILSFSYTDGDGDLGLRSSDTLPPFNKGSKYYYNIYVRYFEKQNGKFVEVTIDNNDGTTDTVNFHGRFPYLTPQGIHKAIRGTFNDTLPVLNPMSDYDTIKFKFFIYDRALHKSNEQETPEIVVLK